MIRCGLCIGFLFSLFVAAAHSQEQKAPATDNETLRRLLDKVDQLDRDLRTVLKNTPKALPENPADRKLVALLETPVLPSFNQGSPQEARLFVAKLVLINLTAEQQTVEASQITLESDGNSLKNGELPTLLQNYAVQIGQQGHSLQTLKPTASLKLASGTTASTWVLFSGLAKAPQVPRMKLKIAVGDKPLEVDLNTWSASKLDLTSKRLGPRGCLALVTLGGELNSLSLGALLDELERLAALKLSRVVIRWSESAPAMDSQLYSWLMQSVQNLGRQEVFNQQFPSLPNSFSEFRLAELPAANGQVNVGPSYFGGPVPSAAAMAAASPIHKTTAEAVIAALRSAYEVVPRNELLDEIRSGDTLTKTAALAGGGGRLATEHLPLILQLADDEEPSVQQAAVLTLRHFGEKEAVERLLHYARKNTEPLASLAVESLASSRYADAHDALLGLIEREGVNSRKTIIKVLAQYPRPVWSETIYKYVRDPQSGLGVDGLQALVRVGHPKLLEVLTEALDSRESAIREAAFVELTNQPDAASETVAVRHTLKHMDGSPPTPQMLALLTKTKNQSAVPLLLKHLKNSNTDRSALINTLAQIGDQSVADALVEHYAQLRTNEQSAVLGVLGQLKSPVFLKLAGPALESSDASVVHTVCQWLQNDGSPAAVKLLIQTFDKTSNPNTITYVANALGQTGSSDALAVLRKGRASNDQHKSQQARQALTYLYQRSPGYQHLAQGQHWEMQKDEKTAMEHYELAIKADPELPDAYVRRGFLLYRQKKIDEAKKDFDKAIELDDFHVLAYSGRANVLVRQEKYPEAKKDFEKVMSLDNNNGEAVTGVGICLAVEGKYEEGIKLVENARAKFQGSGLFLYNVACVYGRALEHVEKNTPLADRDKTLEAFRRKALDDLRASLKGGFNDIEWMKKDPDLKTLHDQPEFQEISGTKSN